MSAHAKLAAIAGARAAMEELLRRIGLPDAKTKEAWVWHGRAFMVKVSVQLTDPPLNGADIVMADVQAYCVLGKRAKVCAIPEHTRRGEPEGLRFRDQFRFMLSSGSLEMAPRTLAPMLLAAMAQAPALAA